VNEKEILALLSELEASQQQALLKLGRRIVPLLTEEDVLQPNDYPELEENPHFRYEEGVLAGIRTTVMALRATLKSSSGAP
jgi:hypothetical protein